MLQSLSRPGRLLTILLISLLSLTAQAASPKEEAVDLSIIKQRDALRPLMSPQQRVAYVKAAELIEEGQSDIRSAQSQLQQKPSALNPHKDIGAIHERGKRLEAEGQAKVNEGQKQIVAILTAVQTKQQASRAPTVKTHHFDLAKNTYQTALEEASTQALQACRDAEYPNVLFDGLRIIQGNQITKAGTAIHNAAYDTLVQIDGTQFRVKVPLALKLEKDDATAALSFQYDNAAAFEGERVALLAIELIAAGKGADTLLSLRALDLNSQQLISSQLYYIADASEVLSPKAEDTSAETTQAQLADAPRVTPASITIDEQNRLLDKLASLPNPYQFEILSVAQTTAQTALLNALIKDTLLKSSSLTLVESDFIQRTYLSAGATSEDLSNTATAALTITPDEGSYTIKAESYSTGRSVEVGTLTLHLP